MTARASMTVSPSSSRTSRSTPCVEGCCGPRLTTIRSSWIGASPPEDTGSIQPPPVTVNTRPSVVSREVAYASVLTADPHGRARLRRGSLIRPPLVWRWDLGALVLDRDTAERIVLALGVPLPVVRHQDPGQAG